MNPIKWLREKAPDFADLSDEEREGVMHFTLLWSFFEAKALHNSASSRSILTITHEWASASRLNIEPFAPSFHYFQNRYFKDGQETEYFAGLNLRKNDCPMLVRAVLKGENTNSADIVSALLIVVFRLRNNLFHGVKWGYGIRGQLDNFRTANAVIMAALETHGHF